MCLCFITLTHTNTEDAGDMDDTFIHIVLNYLNRLGLIQELHVGTELRSSKCIRAKCSIQNQCVWIFLSSQILMLAKKKGCSRHSATWKIHTVYRASQLYIYTWWSCLKLMNKHIRVKFSVSRLAAKIALINHSYC